MRVLRGLALVAGLIVLMVLVVRAGAGRRVGIDTRR